MHGWVMLAEVLAFVLYFAVRNVAAVFWEAGGVVPMPVVHGEVKRGTKIFGYLVEDQSELLESDVEGKHCDDDVQYTWEFAAGGFAAQWDTEVVHGEVKRGTKFIGYFEEDQSNFVDGSLHVEVKRGTKIIGYLAEDQSDFLEERALRLHWLPHRVLRRGVERGRRRPRGRRSRSRAPSEAPA